MKHLLLIPALIFLTALPAAAYRWTAGDLLPGCKFMSERGRREDFVSDLENADWETALSVGQCFGMVDGYSRFGEGHPGWKCAKKEHPASIHEMVLAFVGFAEKNPQMEDRDFFNVFDEAMKEKYCKKKKKKKSKE